MNQLRLTSFMMVAAAATLGLTTGCSSSSSKGGTGGTGVAGSAGLGGKTGSGGTAGSAGGAAGGMAGSVGGAAGGTAGSAGGAAGGTAGSAGGAAGSAGGAAGGAAGSAGGSTGMAGAAGGAGGAGGTPVTTLLVDHDDSDNNNDPPTASTLSASDTFFASRLAAEHIPFATSIVANVANPTTPHYADLTPYSTIVWYTGDAYGKTMTPSQEATLKNWLDAGGKTLLVFSQNLFYDLGTGGDWTSVNNNTFLTDYLGAAGWVWDTIQYVNGQDASLNHNTYTVTGVAGTAFAAMQFTVVADTPINSTADVVNPATGTVPLVTVPSDVLTANANVIAPIAVVRTTAGTAGTSKVLYVGLPVEDIQGAPTNTGADFVHAALKTVGLVQ